MLYDPSGGQGIAFDPQQALPALQASAGAFPQVELVVAGGLRADTVAQVMALLWRELRQLSIDIEGKVRRPGTDELDLDLTIAYLRNACRAYREAATS